MPRAKKIAPAKQPAPTPPPSVVVPTQQEPQVQPLPRNVVYDKVELVERSITSKHGPLTVENAKTSLGWETEKEYQQRMVRENPGSKPEHWLFGEIGPKRSDNRQFQPVHCLNIDKAKVVCWHNANNRPFDDSWAEEIEDMLLRWQWAGPLTVPGETVNGETVRISRYGRVLSGQHQKTGLIRADEKLQKARQAEGPEAVAQKRCAKYPHWDGHDHVVLETILITGLSEDERVLRTIDYVKPRTTADMLYTMELFRKNLPVERKEMTRMLASALDFLWTRTDAKGYRTHPEMVGFLDRHKRLLKCVEHLFVENKATATGGRKISKHRISAGLASTLCYLMACSSDKTTEYSDVYRNESPPSEAGLDWLYWDRAQDFWTCFASSRDFIPVHTALGRLIDSEPGNEDNQGLGGRAGEKLAILAKAWERFKDHPVSAGSAFDEDDLGPEGCLCLSYSDLDDSGNKLPDGRVKLLDIADFKGIDCPEVVTNKRAGRSRRGVSEPPPPSPEEIERQLEEIRLQRIEIERLKEEALRRRVE